MVCPLSLHRLHQQKVRLLQFLLLYMLANPLEKWLLGFKRVSPLSVSHNLLLYLFLLLSIHTPLLRYMLLERTLER
jgi:hypothetical protein